MNRLFYGDNLGILRDHVADASVDLIYLDPPFNSNATYNVLFRSPKGEGAAAQIEAFEDTWHWNDSAEAAFDDVMRSGRTHAAELLRAMRSFLGDNDMMAYLAMMAVRLIELHRVLKDTGSIYLHCDPTASHYLKLVLDAVIGVQNYRNEIVWQRTHSHNFVSSVFQKQNDVLLFYTRSNKFKFHKTFAEYGGQQLKRYKTDANGRLYKAENLTFSTANPGRQFEWRGTRPPANRSWGYDQERLEQLWAAGRILTTREGRPRLDGLIVFLDDMKGKEVGSNWTDIARISNTSAERLGYPTQKPLALLERILASSSNEGDVVLDPFCGCGTAVHAAQKLGRRWLGIDVTHLAIRLIERRLQQAFPGVPFEVVGEPKDLASARDLFARDPWEFEKWAVSLVGGAPHREGKKGADGGIDGLIFFKLDQRTTEKAIVSVKGGANRNVAQVRELMAVVERSGAKMGLLVSLEEPTRPMRQEATAAGRYATPFGEFPRVQLVTIADLLDGRTPALPIMQESPFKKAKRERPKTPQGELI